MLVSMLKDLADSKPKLAHAIKESVAKLEEYLNISRGTKLYILAMGKYKTLSKILVFANTLSCKVINPKIKFGWLKDNWAADAYDTARTLVISAVRHGRIFYNRFSANS